MKTMKYLGCLLALMFAGASAFAAETSWFTAPIADTASMTGWSNLDGWVYVSEQAGGTLNNWSTPTEMSFTAGTKTLPADTTTVKTTVKFTAMDKADFDELAFPVGAKGGLTIVEEEGGSFFYGIVGGEWVKLAGETTDALAGQVEVIVDIYGNNGKFIKYTVGGVPLTYNEAEAIPTTFTGDTISSVSYKGLCEIKSLAGYADANVFNITLPTITGATPAVTDKDGTAITDGKVKVADGPISVTYTAGENRLFSNGEKTITKTGVTIAGDVDLTNDDAFKNASTADVVAKIADAEYLSFAAALGAASDNAVITIIKSTALGTEIDKAVTIAADNAIEISDTKIDVSAALTIAGGTYAGTFDCGDTGSILLMGGQFAQIAKADAQKLCETKYFAQVYNTTGSKVVEGEAPSADIPVAYDPAIIPSGTDAKTYLNDEAKNGFARWENYALGLDPDSEVMPTFVKAASATPGSKLKIANNTPGNPGTGYSVVCTINDDKTDELDLQKIVDKGGLAVVKMELVQEGSVGGLPVDVMTKTIGVDKPTVSSAEKADVKLITVPYKQIDGSAMTIDEVINRANLNEDDTLSIYNGSDYDNYILTNGEWVKVAKGGDKPTLSDAPAPVMVKPGQGLWLKTTEDNFFQYGLVDASKVTIDLEKGWNLVGISGTSLALDAIKNAEDGDQIRVENVETQVPVEYTYNATNEEWTYNAVSTSEVELPNGRKVTKKKVTEMTVSGSIPVISGSGVWYVSKNGTASINL